ncbi:TrmB family transcriptional regulator (plasmid) [Halobaculum sp. CBA1158]|uniref:TrmB family transcriptional regulator n=1 Tax=Halobaculum sp. CBA1158 TaxID=2904243 RepID=UPI001F3B3DCD|nr:TrmB family transcriptional regulator [Halobaculum sp. CBA1158]UIP01392.1 TrmB family transcriptional regulator [Halobaculum sp. CBA1158]
MDLTSSQREILNTLVNGYESTESPMPATEIAEVCDRHVGTIRNLMQMMKSLDLVEGVPGSDGGYVPTERAFEALDRDRDDDGETLGLAHDYDRIDVAIEEIDFVNVHHPEKCRARVSFRGSVARFDVGDPVVVGPTPNSALVLAGQVEAIDESRNELNLDVARMEAPLRR